MGTINPDEYKYRPKCPKCGLRMRPLFNVGWFCPDTDCDTGKHKDDDVDGEWDDIITKEMCTQCGSSDIDDFDLAPQMVGTCRHCKTCGHMMFPP